MPEPADRRLAEARVRVEQFLAELDHVGVEDVGLVSLPAADVAARAPARSVAVTAAEDAGLGPYLARTREDARSRVVRMYDRNAYQPTWAGLNWGRSLGTVEDRVAVAAAVEDAAIGTVAMDVAPADVVEELLEPIRLLISMHPSEAPLSPFAGSGWTPRLGAILFVLFAATTVAVLGIYFGPLGWAVALAIVVATGVAILRGRSTS